MHETINSETIHFFSSPFIKTVNFPENSVEVGTLNGIFESDTFKNTYIMFINDTLIQLSVTIQDVIELSKNKK